LERDFTGKFLEDSKIILIKPSHKRENPLAVTQGGIRKGNIMFTPKHIIGKLMEKFRKNCAFLNFFYADAVDI
jgi:hypothetical protein